MLVGGVCCVECVFIDCYGSLIVLVSLHCW